MSQAYLLSGSNLGPREENLKRALEALNNCAGVVVASSSIYESPAWGFKHPEHFLNQAILLKTDLTPQALLRTILQIEKDLGRKRKNDGYEARTIDIDILFYEDITIDEEKLVIPHPRLHQRRFALLPMSELSSEHRHPLLNKTIRELLAACTDDSAVEKLYKNEPEKEGCNAV